MVTMRDGIPLSQYPAEWHSQQYYLQQRATRRWQCEAAGFLVEHRYHASVYANKKHQLRWYYLTPAKDGIRGYSVQGYGSEMMAWEQAYIYMVETGK
jgi:hypothetical protein